MTSNQIFRLLLNKKKKIFIFYFVISLILSIKIVYAEKIILPVISINTSIITNVDLNNEIKLLKLNYKNAEVNSLKRLAIKNLIETKIKDLETKKINISINTNELDSNLNQYFTKLFNNKAVNLEDDINTKKIKKLLSEKIEIDLKWAKLIKILYLPSLNINLNEINDIVVQEKLNKVQKEKFIISEKNKKLLKYSLSHYNKIKKNYLIKYYEN